ncbi:MAG TPA: hypothetical protein DDZ40_00180 [Deltaproteobacteria bacterium]|nr:hypothetical protein [Deltaproteobacteria bacterium]
MPHGELENGDTEGCPTVFLEAAAHKPNVGSIAVCDRYSIRDGETGFVVDGSDVVAVTVAIVRIMENPENARRMGENGKRRVREDLSPVRGVSRLHDF